MSGLQNIKTTFGWSNLQVDPKAIAYGHHEFLHESGQPITLCAACGGNHGPGVGPLTIDADLIEAVRLKSIASPTTIDAALLAEALKPSPVTYEPTAGVCPLCYRKRSDNGATCSSSFHAEPEVQPGQAAYEAFKAARTAEAVDHPAHYKENGVEVIDVIEAFNLGFCLGNVLKYVLRAGRKPGVKRNCGVEDLKKARWYLDRHIAGLEAGL